jgi:hypothetical protein
MVRPAMQEENCCLVEGNVAAIYPASLRGIISEVDPRALMEFAYLARAKWGQVRFQFQGQLT